ncbi:MAG: ABC transporter ATP-binding protein, partial [Alphaproteobacteria bacterium]|nr:ABC transporter ATP-binding protein [Alphaproteobacteria bacterium]MDA7987506.1 ABC transporter ATP-binding protein [Alphaproteobacteria bacterium]
MTAPPLLRVENLVTRFDTPDGEVRAVNGVSFDLERGDSLGIVGESGSGKTQLFMSLTGLLARNGRASGSALFDGRDLLTLTPRAMNEVRGVRISIIFQDPMTSLNPYLRISRQMTEVLTEHRGMSRKAARLRGIELLERVGIPNAEARFRGYPHEFSGGMRQRIMIAIALLCDPQILIADEPTTALDVTVQAQILDLLRDLRREFGTAVVMITHDLGVVAGLCERVLVLYAGRVVESGDVDDIFHDARHPYTEGLLRSMPRLDEARGEALHAIPGQPPDLQALPRGCAYRARCGYVRDVCSEAVPPLESFAPRRAAAC